MFKKICLISLVMYFSGIEAVFARGGGGGSGGGGGGGGGGGSFGGGSYGGGGSSSSGSGGALGLGVIFAMLFLIVASSLIISIVAKAYKKQKIKKAEAVIQGAEKQDTAWDEAGFKQRVTEVFQAFQKDWTDYNVESMKNYTAPEFYKKMVLELNVLKNQGRQNLVNNPRIKSLTILEAEDQIDNSKDTFTVEIVAVANDVLLDTTTNQKLYTDNSVFTENWHFIREGSVWQLNSIGQATLNIGLVENPVEEFAKKNNFYFDPDFGWLMMPSRGAIFNKTSFKTSDINNHVIGYYRNKIVEFYTYMPVPNAVNYLVAQAILPIKYNDILIKKKSGFNLFNLTGLKKIETESNDFNRKFNLWADSADQVSSFELLTPNFMEKIYNLPFELNIEVVGSFLYLYTATRANVGHEQMLEVLSWAFDEMKL